MKKTYITMAVLVFTTLSFSVQAESLCKGATKNFKLLISEQSNCKASSCRVEKKGENLYFEINPSSCDSELAEFRLSVTATKKNIKPKLPKCDGNASCPSGFDKNGKATISLVQGKVWGEVAGQKSP
jgi:hypothetical protein